MATDEKSKIIGIARKLNPDIKIYQMGIDANAFKNCTNLKTVEFYEDEVIDGTISIGANAFDGYIHSIVDISDHNI